jgi:hypothetical protein
MTKCPLCGDSVSDLESHLERTLGHRKHGIYTLIIMSDLDQNDVIATMIKSVASLTTKIEIGPIKD